MVQGKRSDGRVTLQILDDNGSLNFTFWTLISVILPTAGFLKIFRLRLLRGGEKNLNPVWGKKKFKEITISLIFFSAIISRGDVLYFYKNRDVSVHS